MKTLQKTMLVYTLLMPIVVFFPTNETLAIPTFEQVNVEECDLAFHKAQTQVLSQAAAWKARNQHKALVRNILKNLNQRNAEVSLAGGSLSHEEVLTNLKIMGRLLDILAAEYPVTDEWGYRLESISQQ